MQNNFPKKSRRQFLRFGATSGLVLACLYATSVVLFATLVKDPPDESVFRLFNIPVTLLVLGGSVGLVAVGIHGALTGYFLYLSATRYPTTYARYTWLIGLIISMLLWLLVHFTLGLLLLGLGGPLFWWIFVGYPGILYVIAGSWLSHYFARKP